jgi:hypothetical protein
MFPAGFKFEPSSIQPVEDGEKDMEAAKDILHPLVNESTSTPMHTPKTVSIDNEDSKLTCVCNQI